MSNRKAKDATASCDVDSLIELYAPPHGVTPFARNFSVHKENGRFVVRCRDAKHFAARPEPDNDPVAAQRMCDLLNIGYAMGWSAGEAEAQQAMRRALGLD
jgi:hypothetical protein